MANCELIIPFIFHFAAGVYGHNGELLKLPYADQFSIARKRGWSDDPDDPGGATMIDVTLTTYSHYRKSKGIGNTTKDNLRCITYEEWYEILKKLYWDKWHADKIVSQGVAHLLVDWIWASGYGSIKKAQRILGVTVDGVVGEKTLNAVNSADSSVIFAKLIEEREWYYRNCSGSWKYLKGWLRRLHAIRPDGSFLINGQQIP